MTAPDSYFALFDDDGGGAIVLSEYRRTISFDGSGDPAAKSPWAERKARHLSKLQSISTSAALVVACDKLHNIRTQVADLHHSSRTVEFNAPYEARKAVQVEAIVALQDKISERLYADLCDAHEEWEQLHELAFAAEDDA